MLLVALSGLTGGRLLSQDLGAQVCDDAELVLLQRAAHVKVASDVGLEEFGATVRSKG